MKTMTLMESARSHAASYRLLLRFLSLVCFAMLSATEIRAESRDMLLDDFSRSDLTSALGTRWRGVSDQVMGGLSEVRVARETTEGRTALRLSGPVRLENSGGFIQAALDLSASGKPLDASAFKGVRLLVRGNSERYSVHLLTPDNVRPWQSYRAHFNTDETWRTIDLPFTSFEPYRVDVSLDAGRLRRIGLVAIGRAFEADLQVADVRLYR
jgi:hypothetical protein